MQQRFISENLAGLGKVIQEAFLEDVFGPCL